MTTRFGFKLRPEFGRVRLLRSGVRERLEQIGVAEPDVGRLLLVVDEIVSNAIEHGQDYRQPDDLLTVRFAVHAARIDLEFFDPSVPEATILDLTTMLERCRTGHPQLDSERGRGLFLINDGLDELELRADPDGSGLRIRGRVRRTGP